MTRGPPAAYPPNTAVGARGYQDNNVYADNLLVAFPFLAPSWRASGR